MGSKLSKVVLHFHRGEAHAANLDPILIVFHAISIMLYA
jgi:hypothetical protein